MSQYLFADGISNIVVMNGIVRIHFATASHTEKDGQGSSALDTQCSVAMTPLAFLHSFKKMDDMIGKMTNAGILIKRGEERRSGPAHSTATIPATSETTKQEKKKARKI